MAWLSSARLRRHLASLWLLLAVASSCALLGASDNAFPQPSVVIYPLTGTGQTPAEAGGNIALLLSTRLAQLGGIDVKPYTPGTLRAQYLTAAQTQNVDYYITGFLTPVGADVSLIIQVVSVASGSVIFSNTATVRTYADVVAQADALRSAVLHHAGRGVPDVAPVAAATAAPPLASGGSVNLTKALGRHPARAAGPLPLGLVVAVAGDASDDDKQTLREAFVRDLGIAGVQGAPLPVTASDVAKNAADLCKANPRSIGFFLLTLPAPAAVASLDATAVGCDGATAGKGSASRPVTSKGGTRVALIGAAQAAVGALAPALKALSAPVAAP